MKKVSVSERLPKEAGHYLTWSNISTRKLEYFDPESMALKYHWRFNVQCWLDESADSAPVDVMRLAEDIAHSVTKIGSDTGDIEEAAAKIEALVRKREDRAFAFAYLKGIEAMQLQPTATDAAGMMKAHKDEYDKFTSKP